jgi:formate dehydrogenase assembly factor FdhD
MITVHDLTLVLAVERRTGSLQAITTQQYDTLCQHLAGVCQADGEMFYGCLDAAEHQVGFEQQAPEPPGMYDPE